jgi:hypothetical protein
VATKSLTHDVHARDQPVIEDRLGRSALLDGLSGHVGDPFVIALLQGFGELLQEIHVVIPQTRRSWPPSVNDAMRPRHW